MQKENDSYQLFKLILIVSDALVIYGSYMLGIYLKFGAVLHQEVYAESRLLLPILIIVQIFIMSLYDLYVDIYKSDSEIGISVGISIAITGLVMLVYIFIDDSFIFSRYVIIMGMIFQLMLITANHMLMRQIVISRRGLIKVMIVGDEEHIMVMGSKMLSKYKNRYVLTYAILQGNIPCLKNMIKQVDMVILCHSLSLESKSIISQAVAAEGKTIFIEPDAYELKVKNTRWQQLDDMALLSSSSVNAYSFDRMGKRILDIVLSFIALVVLLPIFIIVALLVKLTSKGPVIFRQNRLTRNGSIYKIMKFRTMVNNAEKDSGPVLAKKNDMRITPLGAFLRKTRLDELPQLWNILVGDMSIVGPRPERPELATIIMEEVPDFDQRLRVKAGLTGMAQVMGNYDTTPSDKLKYDLMYINNYSMMMDLKIMMQTVVIMLVGESSEGVDESKYAEQRKEVIHVMSESSKLCDRVRSES